MNWSGDPENPATQSLQLRKEIFALGGRHRGDALAGALIELQDADLTAERRTLLRAVVTHLSSDRKNAVSGGDAQPMNMKYVVLLGAACIFAAMQLWSMFHP